MPTVLADDPGRRPLALGKSDFDAIEDFRSDRFFRSAPGLATVPSRAWLRQRLDTVADRRREVTDELSLRLVERRRAPLSPDGGFVCGDFDTFVMDQSGTRKECVGRRYPGVDGYAPIAGATRAGASAWNGARACGTRPGRRPASWGGCCPGRRDWSPPSSRCRFAPTKASERPGSTS